MNLQTISLKLSHEHLYVKNLWASLLLFTSIIALEVIETSYKKPSVNWLFTVHIASLPFICGPPITYELPNFNISSARAKLLALILSFKIVSDIINRSKTFGNLHGSWVISRWSLAFAEILKWKQYYHILSIKAKNR